VVEQAVAAVRPALDERQHELEISLPDQPTTLVADGVRLTQVVANLLNNAIRYTDPPGKIALRCRATDETLTIEVTDNGRGIAADLLPRIFGMFVQEQKGGGGLGLGLTLVERLVNLHGGRVYATSDGPGLGATFVVELPMHTSSESSANLPVLAGAPAATTSTGTVTVTVDAPQPRSPVRPLSIVLVDDNPDIRETMFELLRTWGHSVDMAQDGPSAVELILRVKPDLAFVDIGLPKMDGYGVATEVRTRLGPERTRLVAMSGYGQESDRRRSLESGFNAHLVKPADIDDILNIISPAPER
jgi:CheY-like chemotaxis protein